MVDEFVIASEKYGSGSLERKYRLSTESGDVERIGRKTETITARVNQFFKSAFLPQGYPESVSKDYLEYQVWDTMQAFCSSITGTLATQAMLKGYGVGDENATALAATMTWILRSGTGMVGSILFAWIQGSNLDCNAKKWRLFADILNDASILLEMLSPNFKAYFTLLACMSSISKAIVGVAGGATRAAMTQHQARRDNMADVAAKDGSQETLVNLLALVSGLVITPMVSGNVGLTWTLFFIFTFLHLYANFRAVSSVIMETINIPRLHILVTEFLTSGLIMTPQEVSSREPVIFGVGTGESLKIHLGTEFTSVVKSAADFDAALPSSKQCQYIMKLDLSKKRNSGSIHVVLHEDSSAFDHLQSCFQACVLDYVLRTRPSSRKVLIDSDGSQRAMEALYNFWWYEKRLPMDCSWDLVALAHNFTIQAFPTFAKGLGEAGWITSRTHLGLDEWRAVWNVKGLEMKKGI
ncbi:RUS family member 1-like [Montipora capricornis]|uniref:RUS family member 1-like n=1 Tax=Montipora capricornis TaxID=246305 RepID=UPI0035F1585B